MKNNFLNRLLFSAEPDAVLGGNGPAASAPVAETPAAAAETPAANSAAPEPTLLQRVAAGLQSKGTLLAERDTAAARAETAEAENVTLRSQISNLQSQISLLTAERGEIATLLEKATAATQEVETAAAVQVAGLGFEPGALPAAETATPDTRDALEAQLARATDNNQRFALAEKINALN